MNKLIPLLVFLFYTNTISAQFLASKQISDISLTLGREGTSLGSLSAADHLSLGSRMTEPYNFPDSSVGFKNQIRRVNFLFGIHLGIIMKNKSSSQWYSKLRLGLSAGSYTINNFASIFNESLYQLDTLISSVDSSLIYIDSNRVHKLNLDQEGLHIRLSVDYLIYLKTKSKLNAYIGLGAGFNQSITNNLNTNYRAESFIRSNPYNPSWPSVRENLDIVSSQSIHSLKNNSQLQVRLVLGVQCLLSKNERLAGFMEFQPGLSANFQKDYKNSIGNTWLSRLGLLYTFKKKIQKGQTDI